MVAMLSALSTFGRLTVTYAIAFFFSRRIFSKFIRIFHHGVTEPQRKAINFSPCLSVSVVNRLSIRANPWQKKLKLIRLWLLRVRVIIKPAPRLPPVPPCHHHPLQQRRRRETPLFVLVIHPVGNVVSR